MERKTLELHELIYHWSFLEKYQKWTIGYSVEFYCWANGIPWPKVRKMVQDFIWTFMDKLGKALHQVGLM